MAISIATVAAGCGGTAARSSACDLSSYSSQGRSHDFAAVSGFDYNSFPPTSGPADPEPARWRSHDEPLSQTRLLHNLAHGGIVVQYGSNVPPETIERIVRWYEQDPNGLVVAPLPELGDAIVLTAWTELARCAGFDETAFTSFRDDHRYHGPERLPAESLRPQTTEAEAGATLLENLLVLPRPFIEAATIGFVLGADAATTVRIEDANGRPVRTIDPGTSRTAGEVSVSWDRLDDEGAPVEAGVYVVIVEAVSSDGTQTASSSISAEAA